MKRVLKDRGFPAGWKEMVGIMTKGGKKQA